MESGSRWLVLYGALFAAFAFLCAAALLILPAGETPSVVVSDVTSVVAAGVGAILALRAAVKGEGRTRFAWALIATAMCSWFAAEMTWGFYELALDHAAPFPSAADVGYIGAIPLMCAGVVMIASPARSIARVRTTLDALTFFFAGSAIVWHLVVWPSYSSSGAPFGEKIVASAYPVGDLMLMLGLFLATANNRRGRSGTVLAVLLAGVAMILVSDLGYSYLELFDGYSTGSLLDAGWIIGYLAIGLSGALQSRWGAQYVEPTEDSGIPNHWRRALPMALIAANFGILAAAGSDAPLSKDIPFLVLDGLAVAAVTGRLSIVVWDDARLQRALVEAREKLEAKVQQLSRIASILEATPDFVATADAECGLTYMNGAARRLVSAGDGSLPMPEKICELFPSWAREIIEKRGMPAAIETGYWQGETALQMLDGREVPVSQVVISHKSPDGATQFFSTIARDISERKQFESRLLQLANRDSLTNLFNRRRFEEEVERELADSKRFGSSAGILFIDLDQFKVVNDSLGHRAGDELLLEIAQVLRSETRETDVVARLGGDEFGVLLPHSGRESAEELGARILSAIRRRRFVVSGRPVAMTASIGVAIIPNHGSTIQDVLASADIAMYQAKDSRDKYVVYSGDLATRATLTAELSWEQRIRDALEEDRFVLVAQPIEDLRSGAVSYELLLRMRGDDGKLVEPDNFLPTAERTHLIQAIDRWVARRAIEIVAMAQARGLETRFEANLSGKAFADGELLSLIQKGIQDLGVNPRSIIFEVTETAAVASIGKASEFMSALRSIGCGFAIDDFGVGFSSLFYLKHLPVDYLKIDGGFVRDLPHDVADQHLVRAVVELAHGLGKETIAEWVGDSETYDLLRNLGVDHAQGFYVGRPASVEEALAAAEDRFLRAA